MRIVIDLQGAQTGSRFRGIGRYSTQLAQAMARQSRGHEVWLCLNDLLPDSMESIREAFSSLVPASRIVSFAAPAHTYWDTGNAWRRQAAEVLRESFVAGLRPDVVHVCSLFEGAQEDAIASIGRWGGSPPTAVTLYDLIPLLNPRDYLGAGWVRDWYSDRIESLRRADLLLSISAHAREEAIEVLGIQPDRIVNISSAVSEIFRPLVLDDAARLDLTLRLGVRQPYVMYSCAFDSRKNVDRLLQAFAALPASLREFRQLVVAGRVPQEEAARLGLMARELGIADALVLTGFIDDEDLVRLYNGAELYVFPSLHEGFGLPALEAMACGTATIGSATTSVPEVIGRSDALFNPTSVDDIARVMGHALENAGFMASLRAHAREQSRRFSWDATAARALDAFEALHGEKRRSGRQTGFASVSIARNVRQQIASIGRMASNGPICEADVVVVAEAIAANRARLEALPRALELPDQLSWRLEGPFDSSYSLALVNRELAAALSAGGHKVALHSTEGPGDFTPDPRFLEARPDLAAMYEEAQRLGHADADVASRDLYPPRVADMEAPLNLLHCYAWEESGFPPEWVDQFNESLDGIACLSTHVEKLLIDNGVAVPLSVSGCGVDHWERVTPEANYASPGKSFRFLHVSSCFPRKGADALLIAYGRAFRESDDVSLVVKTFANPHNQIGTWLADARRDDPDYPDVVVIEEDMNDARLKALYEQCHALVAPSRAEGYGLPLAEAMLSGLAVITTGWSGQLDFCSEETAWLVDYCFAPAKSHFNLYGSAWVDPDVADLARAMREVYSADASVRKRRAAQGRERLLQSHTWPMVAHRLVQQARSHARRLPRRSLRVGVITTWNTRCGIATYAAHLLEQMDVDSVVLAPRSNDLIASDDGRVLRCWSNEQESLDELEECIEQTRVEALLIQFNYGFFELEVLADFIVQQGAKGRLVVVEMHATAEPLAQPHKRLDLLTEALRSCSRVLVHSIADMNRLKAVGVVDNVALFPHGVLDVPELSPAADTGVFRIASYGFFLPHKGLSQLVEAVGMLVRKGLDVHLDMVNAEYPAAVSREEIEAVRQQVAELGLADRVTMETRFLSDSDSLAALAAAHAIVFPYQGTGESASGAVRYGLASGKPVAVTPIDIFDDVRAATYTLPGTEAADIAAGLERFFADLRAGAPVIQTLRAEGARWRDAHRYSRLGARLENMLKQLHARANDHNNMHQEIT